jgi:hypothetical protein
MIWLVRNVPEGVPFILVLLVGLIFFIAGGLAYLIFTALRAAFSTTVQAKLPPGQRPSFLELDPALQAASILLWSVLLVVVFFLFSVATSLVFGKPLDMRHWLEGVQQKQAGKQGD